MTPREMEMLSAYHDGELSARDKAEVERLLTGSAEARAALEQFRRMSAMVGGLQREAAPEGFQNRFAARAEREALLGTGERVASRSAWGLTPLRWTAMAAAIALAVTGWYIYQPPYATGRKEPIIVAEHGGSVLNQLESATSEGKAQPAPTSVWKPSAIAPAAEIKTASRTRGDDAPRIASGGRKTESDMAVRYETKKPAIEVREIEIDVSNRKEALTRVYKFIAETGAVRVPPEQAEESNVAVPGLDYLFLGAPNLPGLGGGDEVRLFVEQSKSNELFASLVDLQLNEEMEADKETDLAKREVVMSATPGGNVFGEESAKDDASADEVQFVIRFVSQPIGTSTDGSSQPTSGPAR